MIVPRSEYPRPQFVRSDWLCLNGEWQFEIDSGDSGFERGLVDRELKDRITVPFCPESVLSGIGNTDFLNSVWYRREVDIPSEWAGKKVLLNFQAVDYDTTVWVNGVEVGRHRGGFTPFSCDLRGVARPGEKAVITIRARDDMRIPKPLGKQSNLYANMGCHYTRTTGIWQSVWMEPVTDYYMLRSHITPDPANSMFRIEQPISRNLKYGKITAELKDEKGVVCRVETPADGSLAPMLDLVIPQDRVRQWSPRDPFLYGLEITYTASMNTVLDKVESYAGLRSVHIKENAVYINDKAVFQRLVLDQGYYPDGIMTAPTDDDLVKDIELSMQAGFNGARLHQKVFEERFLYHADRLGYLVWGEFGDWGCGRRGPDDDHQKPGSTYITQWIEALHRDYSHPCIVGWCPLNETHQVITDKITDLDDVTWGMFLATKAIDLSRPVLDTSGYSHRVPFADVYDSHDYDQNPDTLRERHDKINNDEPFVNDISGRAMSVPYRGQPYFVSEFGGIWWNPKAAEDEYSWGYGDRPKTIEEFYERFKGLCDALLDNPRMFGYCYTQLTDVFQEQNGIYFFDRSVKFDMERLRSIQQRDAEIERICRISDRLLPGEAEFISWIKAKGEEKRKKRQKPTTE